MRLKDLLDQKKPVLLDGAFMSVLDPNRPAVQQAFGIHKQYIEAGSQAVLTGTFDLDFSDLEQAEKNAEALILQAQKASEVVIGDLGLYPNKKHYPLAAKWMMEKGIHDYIIETQSEFHEDIAKNIKEMDSEAFIIYSFAVNEQGYSEQGLWAGDLLKAADSSDFIDAIGLNCMIDPYHMAQVLKKMPAFKKPVLAKPNGGYPVIVHHTIKYTGSKEYFASCMPALIKAGASMIGGCCGSTPEFIQLSHKAIQGMPLYPVKKEVPEKKKVSVKYTNDLEDAFSRKSKVIAVELDPPRNDDIASFITNAKRLQQTGIHTLTIADNPIGRARADSSILAGRLKREMHLEAIPHMTCRDRNLNAIQSSLLALSAEDIHNVLIVTGDPLPAENKDLVKSVYNFNSRKLAKFISSLNNEILQVPFQIYGALDINAVNFDIQLNLAKEKEENGIIGFLTQPVLSKKGYENLVRARKELKGRILAGLYPVISHKNALFLHNQVHGILLDQKLIDQYENLDRDQAEKLALKTTLEIARAIKDYCDGYYLMTPFNRIELMERIIENLPK